MPAAVRPHPFRLILVATAFACSEPPAAVVPEGAEPPRPASDDCEPPYPMSFAQDHFFFADLDTNRTCTQFIEQDRCVLGIFEDCVTNDGQSTPARQWTGWVDTEGTGRTVQLSGTTAGAAVIARSPSCCEGALMPTSEGPVEWALLACRLNRCGNPRDVAHVGVYFERLRSDLDPQGRVLDPLSAGAAEKGPVWVDGRRELWLLGNGQITLVPVDGRYSNQTIDIPGEGGQALVVTPTAVYAASDDTVTRIELSSLQMQPTTLAGPIQAMSQTSAGLLIACALSTNPEVNELVLLNPQGQILGTALLDGEVDSIAALDDHEHIAVVARRGEPNLIAVAADLTLRTFLDFTDDTGDQITVLDLVEDFAIPKWLVGLPRGWIGFVDQCNAQVLTQCWFEVSEDKTVPPVRVGIPAAASLGPVWYDRTRDRVVVADREGQIVIINRTPLRPHLQETIKLPGELRGLTGVSTDATCTATSTAYAYLRDLQEVRPVSLTGFCPG